MEKPIEDWLSELPDGYRERALENRKKFPTEATQADSMDEAVEYGFLWKATPEGRDFWESVYDYFNKPSLPPLPE